MKSIKQILNPTKQVMLANVATAGFAFITFFILVRTLDLSVFGEWVLYITSFNLAEMVRTGFARQALVHFLASSTNNNDKHRFKSSGLYLTIFVAMGAGMLFYLFYLIFFQNSETGVGYFFLLYPFVGLITIVPSFDTWISQANRKNLRMSGLTFLPAFLFSIVAVASFWYPLSLLELLLFHAFTRVLLATYSLFSNKEIIASLVKPNLAKVKQLWSFGRYSIATLFGTNLLKSADNFLIGYFMGPTAVAIYNVPLKLLEIAEIPTRSLGQVIFPKFSVMFARRQYQKLNNALKSNILKLLAWYFPISAIVFFAAEYLVVLVGGEAVAEGAIILRVFLVYVLLLPIDRLVGVAIDSTGAPKFNSIKVWIMVFLNILGDALVLYFFESLWAVAAVTIVNAAAGVFVGSWLLKVQFQRKGFNFNYNLKDNGQAA